MPKHMLNGAWYTTTELSERCGIPAHTIRDRLRRGYPVEEAIRPIATHDSVREFSAASCYEDWLGMPMDALHKIYWKWCIQHGYTPLQKKGFSRQLIGMYPMFKTVPTKRNDGYYRVIRLRG